MARGERPLKSEAKKDPVCACSEQAGAPARGFGRRLVSSAATPGRAGAVTMPTDGLALARSLSRGRGGGWPGVRAAPLRAPWEKPPWAAHAERARN